jgi:hypothetical protein
MTRFQDFASMGQSSNARRQHKRQVGVARLEAALRDHAMDPAAMVGLMVEHMGDKDTFRARNLHLRRARVLCQLAVEPGRVE